MHKNVVKTYIDKLHELGILIDAKIPQDVLDLNVDCLSYDNRNLHGTSIFICKGANFKPEYAYDAFKNGAVAYISENEIEGLENCILVNDVRIAIQHLAILHFGNPATILTNIGITGTKGKSSITYILQGILNRYLKSEGKKNCAIISSIDTYDGVEKFESHLTTPEPIELQQHFYNAKESGISHLIMEVSSQALKYDRVFGIPYEVGCFTNFGEDHISNIEHPDVEDYFKSKLKIFDQSKFACIYSGSDRFDEILAYAKNKCDVVTYGYNETDDVFCSEVKPQGSHIDFHVRTKVFESDMTIGMPGIFNVENALAAIAISLFLNIPEKFISEGLAQASVPGRMKVVTSFDKKISIIVDYAHNKMSFEALYESLKKEYPKHKIVGIFGCPGGKANDRREDLPKVASKYADNLIIVEEDSGPEPFDSISSDIVKNIEIDNYEVIEDRDIAIKHAIFDLCEVETVIALTGKGEETRLKRGDNYDPCESDLSIAEKYISKYDKSVGK